MNAIPPNLFPRPMSASEWVAYAGVPAALQARLARRLVDGGCDPVAARDSEIVAGVIEDFASDVAAEEAAEAATLGVSTAVVGARTAAVVTPSLRIASVLRADAAPSCDRCGSPMKSGVKIAGNIPVFYCLVDKVVKIDAGAERAA